MSVQFIETKNGRLAVLSEAEYRKLVERADDAADIAAIERFRARLARGEEELIPSAIANRLLAGESPVRVWREHRGMTARELAGLAAITPAYLSQIEGGQREGSFDTMRRLAEVLRISLDDLAGTRE